MKKMYEHAKKTALAGAVGLAALVGSAMVPDTAYAASPTLHREMAKRLKTDEKVYTINKGDGSVYGAIEKLVEQDCDLEITCRKSITPEVHEATVRTIAVLKDIYNDAPESKAGKEAGELLEQYSKDISIKLKDCTMEDVYHHIPDGWGMDRIYVDDPVIVKAQYECDSPQPDVCDPDPQPEPKPRPKPEPTPEGPTCPPTVCPAPCPTYECPTPVEPVTPITPTPVEPQPTPVDPEQPKKPTGTVTLDEGELTIVTPNDYITPYLPDHAITFGGWYATQDLKGVNPEDPVFKDYIKTGGVKFRSSHRARLGEKGDSWLVFSPHLSYQYGIRGDQVETNNFHNLDLGLDFTGYKVFNNNGRTNIGIGGGVDLSYMFHKTNIGPVDAPVVEEPVHGVEFIPHFSLLVDDKLAFGNLDLGIGTGRIQNNQARAPLIATANITAGVRGVTSPFTMTVNGKERKAFVPLTAGVFFNTRFEHEATQVTPHPEDPLAPENPQATKDVSLHLQPGFFAGFDWGWGAATYGLGFNAFNKFNASSSMAPHENLEHMVNITFRPGWKKGGKKK